MKDRIAALFHKALELSPEQRAIFLDRVYKIDEKVGDQLSRLLHANAKAAQEANMDPPILRLTAEEIDESAKKKTPPPQHVGSYRLGQLIDRGGMGEVYIGHRTEGTYSQQVAIKVMRTGFNSDEHVKRFQAERHILASLKHPNIAQLIDGGVTTDGRPYIVMEYIPGEPITDFCDRHRLTVNQRLRLFRKVCNAVQTAHQRLIVHRDIKPDNILVTKKGIPKLLDFGIAKALEPEAIDATLAQTQEEVKLSTPAYAAPEQVKGEPITTSTDVYALGILLYELLTGMKPYDFTDLSRYEIEKRICEALPARPSYALTEFRGVSAEELKTIAKEISSNRKTDPRQLTRRLRGELDDIVLMAIRKEPEHRYGSAASLGDDIFRYLNKKPVEARQDNFKYRTKKFLQRNRIVLGVSLLLAVLITGFAFREMTLRQSEEAARVKAENEAVTSEAIASFMVEFFDVAEPFSEQAMRTDTMRIREFLLHRASKLKELHDQPAVKMRALSVVGRMYYSFGAYDEARSLIEESVSIADSLYTDPDEDALETLHVLAELEMIQGDYDTAIAHYEDALKDVVHLDPPDSLLHASILNGLGDLARVQWRYEEAEAHHREALAIRQKMTGENSLLAAHSYNNLGLVLYDLGVLDESESMLTSSIAAYRTHVGDTKANVSAVLNNLGLVYAAKKQPEAAIRVLEEALEIKRVILGDNHWRVAHGMTNLAWNVSEAGDQVRAERMLFEAYDIMVNALGEEHSNTANVLSKLGSVAFKSGKLEEAEGHLSTALEIQRETLPADHIQTASTMHQLGLVLVESDRLREAKPYFEQALAIQKRKFTLDNDRAIQILMDWADLAKQLNTFDEIEPHLRQAAEVMQETGNEEMLQRINTLLNS